MSLEERILTLKRSNFFRSLAETDLRALAEAFEEESFSPGEIVLAVGEPADRIFIVVEGTLEIHARSPSGDNIRVGPGALFGEYGMFDMGLRTATVTSVDQARLLSLDYQRFRAFLVRFPEATLAILGTTVRQLLATQRATR